MMTPDFTARVRLAADMDETAMPKGELSADLTEDLDRRLRLAAVDLKWRLFEIFRQHMDGKVPTYRVQAAVSPNYENTTVEPNPERLAWGQLLYISMTYPLDDPMGFRPPMEVADKTSAMFWIASKLNEEWGTKPKIITTLQSLTRLAAVVRRNGETNPVIPLAFFDQYQKMEEAERHAFLRKWFSWVSHGDSFTHDEDGVCRPGPDASFTLTARGKIFRAAVVFDVSPLYLNLDVKKGRANYLIRVGLPWDGDLGSPDTWADDERRAMWEALFRSFEALSGYYQTAAPLPEHIEVTQKILPEMPPRPEQSVAAVLNVDSILDAEWDAAPKTIVPPEQAADEVSATSLPTNDNRPLFPVALGHVPVDSEVLSIIQHAGRLEFPRRWSTIPRWADLEREEKHRLLSEHGPAAFKPRGDVPPLLERKSVRGLPEDQWQTILGAEAVQALKLRHGPKGYLMVDPQTGSENFCKCVQRNGEILLEMQVSWHGLAGPFVHDWRERMIAAVEEQRLRLESNRLPLFEDLDAKDLAKLDRALQDVTLYERGQRCMEVIIGQVAMQGRTTVEIRADVFRTLFWLNGDPPQNWKRDVEAILNALRKIDIVIRSGGRKHMGGFLYSIETEDDQNEKDRGFRYIGRGQGGHGDGFYQLRVNEAFIGCLRVFEGGVGTLRGGGSTRLLNFQKTLDKDEKEVLQSGYARVHNGTPLFSASAAHTQFQVNLVRFIERNITLKKDPLAGTQRGPRASHKVKDGDLEAALPREYDATFCPLLPAGRTYVAALGHFRRAPEAGFTLYGTKRARREKAGAKPGGIIEKIGRPVPSGNAHKTRENVLTQTLADLRRVVVDDFGGVVVGRLTEKERTDGGDGPLWFPLDRFRGLDDSTLGHKLKIFIFLPTDWEKRRQEAFEEKTGYRVTDKPAEAEAAAWGGEADVVPLAPGEVTGPENGWRGLSLPERLLAAMRHRGLKQKDIARIFGVTDGQVTRWLAPARGVTDAAKVARIPDDMGVLMARWIKAGTEPDEGVLKALESRLRSPARRLKN